MKNNLAVEHKRPLVKNNQLEVLLQQMYGKPFPSEIPLEENIVGLIITYGNALYKKIKWLGHSNFYDPSCQLVFYMIEKMDANGEEIDLLTLTNRMKKEGKLKKVGPVRLVELGNNNVQPLHIERHAKLIHEAFLAREALEELSRFTAKIIQGTVDIFDTRNELANKLRVIPPTSFFQSKTMNQALEDGKNAPPMLKLAGHILRTGEITILFAEPGIGKSIFAMQLADNISRGKPSFGDILQNEHDPMKVLFYDFELLEQELYERYSNAWGDMYEFDEDQLIRMSENDDYRQKSGGVNIVDFIEDNIETLKPDVVIIDNITWITAESSHDTEVAKKLMERLKRINKRTSLPFLILAHSTKRTNKAQPLTQGDMAGSAHLLRFATNIIGIGRSAIDSELRYIKQVKQRNGQEIYNEENVITCTIEKELDGKMLRFVPQGFDSERNHLADFNSVETQEDLIEEAIKLRLDHNYGWNKVREKIGFRGSKNTLKKRCEEMANDSLQYELAPNGEIQRTKALVAKQDTVEEPPVKESEEEGITYTASMPIEKSTPKKLPI